MNPARFHELTSRYRDLRIAVAQIEGREMSVDRRSHCIGIDRLPANVGRLNYLQIAPG